MRVAPGHVMREGFSGPLAVVFRDNVTDITVQDSSMDAWAVRLHHRVTYLLTPGTDDGCQKTKYQIVVDVAEEDATFDLTQVDPDMASVCGQRSRAEEYNATLKEMLQDCGWNVPGTDILLRSGGYRGYTEIEEA